MIRPDAGGCSTNLRAIGSVQIDDSDDEEDEDGGDEDDEGAELE